MNNGKSKAVIFIFSFSISRRLCVEKILDYQLGKLAKHSRMSFYETHFVLVSSI